jgi:ATP-dependent protease HslVU (ClpYQ) peptidase subunit
MITPLSQPWPWSSNPEPSPADWGIGMTVCIAVYSRPLDAFVCATDSMISTGDMSADGMAMKFAAIWGKFIAMFSGNDITSISPIINEVRAAMPSVASAETAQALAEAFKIAFMNQRKKRAEAMLIPPGMTLTEFYENGLVRLGPEIFSRIFNEIERLKLDVQFLVCGFEGAEPMIFTISDPGVETHYDLLGFWAIGSGNNNALGSLFNLHGTAIRYHSPETALYRTLEAKFFAESASGVGKETTCFQLKSNGRRGFIKNIVELRNIWEASNSRPIPEGAAEVGSKILKESKRKLIRRSRRIKTKTEGS